MNIDASINDLEDSSKRKKAATSLGGITAGAVKAVPALVKFLLTDKDQGVRKEILKTLGRIASRPAGQPPSDSSVALSVLVEASMDDRERVFRRAAAFLVNALSHSGGKLPTAGWVYPILGGAMRDNLYFAIALEAMDTMPTQCREWAAEEGVPAIGAALSRINETQRWAALGLLAKFGESAGPAVPTLAELLLRTKDTEHQERILEIMEGLEDDWAVLALDAVKSFVEKTSDAKLRDAGRRLMSRILGSHGQLDSMIRFMNSALKDSVVVGCLSYRERELIFGFIVKNWRRKDDEIAWRLCSVGLDLGSELKSITYNVGEIKNRCKQEYDRKFGKSWWQFWK